MSAQCTAHRRKPVSVWGYHGNRFRCPNEATVRASFYSTAGNRVGRFVICDEHRPEGRLGIDLPHGYEWQFEPLADLT